MDVKHIANLANLPISSAEEDKFASQFSQTLKTISLIDELDTSRVSPTYQVTGLTNITRPDKIDTSRIIPQQLVLSQAHSTYKDFVVVPRIIDE